MQHNTLVRELNRVKNENGLVGGPLKVLQVDNADSNVSACINPHDWSIELKVKKGWNPLPDKRVKSYSTKRNLEDALWSVCRDVVLHEVGHWELPRGSEMGCPYSVDFHDQILDGVTKVLKPKKLEGCAHYVSNALEDLINNTNVKGKTSFAGQVLFWYDQGLSIPNKKFTPFYESFVLLNMYCFGDNIDEELVSRFYTGDKKVVKAVKELIKSFVLKRHDRENNIKSLFDKESWGEMSETFARITLPLLEQQLPSESLFGTGSEAPGKSEQNKKQEGQSAGSSFDKKLSQPREREKICAGRFASGGSCPSYMDSFEYLDKVYTSLARSIPVQVDSFNESLSFPVAKHGWRWFDPEQDDANKVKLSRVGLQEDGSVGFKVGRHELTVDYPYRKNVKGFPKLKVAIIDTSDSMKESLGGRSVVMNPESPEERQWNSDCKYHYALVGWYGIQRFLESQHIAQYVDNSVVNFSDNTRTSGRKSWRDLNVVKKLLFSPQFGGTTLDERVINQELSDDDCFVLSLSDGDIQNWDSVKESFKKNVVGKKYAHIHLGSANKFTSDLKRWGVPVYFVKSGEDLSRLMVKVTGDQYKSYAREVLAK